MHGRKVHITVLLLTARTNPTGKPSSRRLWEARLIAVVQRKGDINMYCALVFEDDVQIRCVALNHIYHVREREDPRRSAEWVYLVCIVFGLHRSDTDTNAGWTDYTYLNEHEQLERFMLTNHIQIHISRHTSSNHRVATNMQSCVPIVWCALCWKPLVKHSTCACRRPLAKWTHILYAWYTKQSES